MKRKIKILILIFSIILIGIILSFSLWYLKYYSKKSFEEKKIESFIRENLNKKYRLPSLNVQNGLAVTGSLGGAPYLYASIWEKEGKRFWVALHYNETKAVINDLKIIITPNEKLENLDKNIALSISKNYFKKINENWNCETLENNTIFCESFWKEEKTGAKKGVGIIRGPNLEYFIYFCIHPIGSEFYEWRSCAEQKK